MKTIEENPLQGLHIEGSTDSQNTSNNHGEHQYRRYVNGVQTKHDHFYTDDICDLPADETCGAKLLKSITSAVTVAYEDKVEQTGTNNLPNQILKLAKQSVKEQCVTNANLKERQNIIESVCCTNQQNEDGVSKNKVVPKINSSLFNLEELACEDQDDLDIDIVITFDTTTRNLSFTIVTKDMMQELYSLVSKGETCILASSFDEASKDLLNNTQTSTTESKHNAGNSNHCVISNLSAHVELSMTSHNMAEVSPGGGDSLHNRVPCILDAVDNLIPRIGPKTIIKHVTFKEPHADSVESLPRLPDLKQHSPVKDHMTSRKEQDSPRSSQSFETRFIYNKRYHGSNDDATKRSPRKSRSPVKSHKRSPQKQSVYDDGINNSKLQNAPHSPSTPRYENIYEKCYGKDHTENRAKNYNKLHNITDKANCSAEKHVPKTNVKTVGTANHFPKRTIISFSEDDLVYSSNNFGNKDVGKSPIKSNSGKQITILKRGQKISNQKPNKHDTKETTKAQVEKHVKVYKNDEEVKGKSGKGVLYLNHHTTIDGNKKYNNKSTINSSHVSNKANVSSNDNVSKATTIKLAFPTEARENTDKSKGKSKKKKKKNSKSNVKIPPTKIQLLQRLFEYGQIKSMFSRYKTDSLRQLKLIDTLHEGTFSTKYKASYQNELVVLTVYSDQITDDIDAIDMASLRNSYFIDGVKDCMTGPPSASMWLMCKFHPLGNLHDFLLRDVQRHVIGEKHAQFIAASVLIGVHYLHQHDIVHGNIKPSKILLNNQGFPVLTGFLKSHEVANCDRRDVYTPAYAAPERFRGNRGTSVDVFSVGCVIYEIVTGRTPFDSGSIEETKANIIDQEYRPLYEPELFSFAGEFFVDGCLRKNPNQRFIFGENREHLNTEEWLSTLDLKILKKQMMRSPLLNAMQHIDNHAHMDVRKMVNYDWGRVMDVTCPNTPSFLDLNTPKGATVM